MYVLLVNVCSLKETRVKFETAKLLPCVAFLGCFMQAFFGSSSMEGVNFFTILATWYVYVQSFHHTLTLSISKQLRIPAKNCHRMVVLGSSKAGKTSIVSRFLHGHFNEQYIPTIDEFHRKLYRIRGEVYQLDVLDTSGNLPYPAMRRLSILTGDIFLLVFSIDSHESFKEVVRLREQIIQTKSALYNRPLASMSSFERFSMCALNKKSTQSSNVDHDASSPCLQHTRMTVHRWIQTRTPTALGQWKQVVKKKKNPMTYGCCDGKWFY
uniref:Ras related dexamethasone induced 1 n=1 Tax=Eptatretus burgeri TaxID=7764 RepID=A0A8C4Q137_EPTBU